MKSSRRRRTTENKTKNRKTDNKRMTRNESQMRLTAATDNIVENVRHNRFGGWRWHKRHDVRSTVTTDTIDVNVRRDELGECVTLTPKCVSVSSVAPTDNNDDVWHGPRHENDRRNHCAHHAGHLLLLRNMPLNCSAVIC